MVIFCANSSSSQMFFLQKPALVSGVGFLHLRVLALSELCLEQVVLIKLTQPSLDTSAGQMVHLENETLDTTTWN